MKKILVIDDEVFLREMVSYALSQKGYGVVEATNGEEGVAKARNELPDLILCDVNMEKMDGYGTLSALREQPATAAIPFILMTGMADPAGMRQGMELGADDYLPKPFTIDTLYAAVDVRLKKTSALRAEAERKLSDLRENISLMLPHELRTPLNGILAYGEILAADAATLPPEEIAEMGQEIYQSGKRLEHLVENFLIFAQIEMLGSDPQKQQSLRSQLTVQAAAVVEKYALEQGKEANRLADLSLELGNVAVPMSANYLGKMVAELVHNACKFSTDGSPIKITLTEAGDDVVLTVTDQGRGFSPEHIAQVGAYMQFDRKLHEQQGLGLGLTICKRLTELHGGGLTIQSQPATGAAVSVKLPKAKLA